MASGSSALSSPRPRPRAELVLAVAGLLTFALIPIHINTIYSGLPAHPLFLHVPVILIPVVGIAALALAARPSLLERHGVWVAALSVTALAATNLTIGAGQELRDDLHLNGGGFGPSALIARHADAADDLRLLLIAFTAVLICTLAIYRAGDPIPTGPSHRLLVSARPLAPLLRSALAALALASMYFVFHTGDLGAKAVWQGRLGHGGGPPAFQPGGGGGGGGGTSGLFTPSGG